MTDRAILPRFRTRRLRSRAVAIGALAAALTVTIAVPPRPLLVWNASASAPIGLYAVGTAGDLDAGDMVVARMPSRLRPLAARRRYIPINVPLVKRVAGVPGDTVCAIGAVISVNGRHVAVRQRSDGAGRPMPWWKGCVTLRHGTVFLLMTGTPASFDGRYFGPTARTDIIGKASLIWLR